MSRSLIFLVFLAAAAIWSSPGWSVAQDSEPRTNEVSTANRPSTASPRTIVAGRGTVELDQEAVLATDQPGTLETIGAVEGERVEAGQVIAKLKSKVAEAAVAVAAKTASSDIDIRFAQAAHAVAVKELEKSLEANRRNSGNIPDIEIARLELAAKRAELQIEKATLDQEIARLTLDQKQAELDRHTIKSPLDGIVIEVIKHPGEAVQQGDPIMHVVNTDVVRVEGFVTVGEAARVRPGDPVEARIDASRLDGLPPELAEMTFDGTVMFVDPTVGTIGGDIRVWARVENPENLLKAGLPATMTITPSGEIPSTASTQESPR